MYMQYTNNHPNLSVVRAIQYNDEPMALLAKHTGSQAPTPRQKLSKDLHKLKNWFLAIRREAVMPLLPVVCLLFFPGTTSVLVIVTKNV